jgi:hypothetical protein
MIPKEYSSFSERCGVMAGLTNHGYLSKNVQIWLTTVGAGLTIPQKNSAKMISLGSYGMGKVRFSKHTWTPGPIYRRFYSQSCTTVLWSGTAFHFAIAGFVTWSATTDQYSMQTAQPAAWHSSVKIISLQRQSTHALEVSWYFTPRVTWNESTSTEIWWVPGDWRALYK